MSVSGPVRYVRHGRFGAALYLDALSEKALPARRVNPGADGAKYDEAWLQDLLFNNPAALPVAEIEPAFDPLIPLCRELQTPAGPADILFMSDSGLLTLVETKLWKNPQARRDAIVQVLDYAKELASWSYQRLETAVRRATGKNESLYQIVEEQVGEIDEPSFVDQVQRNLTLGRMLVMVVGDGIREGVEEIVEYLQRHVGLHLTFGLVEAAIYRMPEAVGGFLILPRVMVRTVEIERAVVSRVSEDVRISESSRPASDRPTGITEEQFYEEIGTVDATLPKRLRDFFIACEEVGISITVSKASLILHWAHDELGPVNFGTIFPRGTLRTNYICDSARRIGDVEIGVRYLNAVALLIPGSRVRKRGNEWSWKVVLDDRDPPIAPALERADEWLAHITTTMNEFRRTVDKDA